MTGPAMDMLKQVRRALDDIRQSLTDVEPYEPTGIKVGEKAIYQIDLLRKMIDEQPSRQHPWSYYQPMVAEEFEG